jgi:hypothetical protein
MPGAVAIAVLVLASSCGAVEGAGGEERATLARYGIEVTPPVGWRARLTRATVEASIRSGELRMRMFEYEPEPDVLDETRRTHPPGPPRPFRAGEFASPELGGDNPEGEGFARRNFSLAGRYFDLFAESVAAEPSEAAVDGLNELVSSLEVSPGDFYPGTIAPPRFEPADGWYAGFDGGGEVRATDHAFAWASTVPYRNGPRDAPPRETLETLPAGGIVVWAWLARDNRFPPTAEPRGKGPPLSLPIKVGRLRGGFGWEGQVGDVSLYRLWGWIGEQYTLDLWIFYGRREPTEEQQAQAQDALDRLRLPDWGSWELDVAR